MTSILCFYHAPCNDGSAAAAALRYRLAQAHYRDSSYELYFCPLSYTTDWDAPFPEEFLKTDIQPSYPVSDIFIVDLSMSRTKADQLLEHLRNADRISGANPPIVCIDHHQTALDKIEQL